MAELEQGLEELKVVKQAFKENISANNVSTSNVEFRNMPELIKQMEKKLPTQTKTVTPTTSAQSITADAGYKLTGVEVGAVTKAIDENIKAENIKQGVTILGETGTLEVGSGDLVDVTELPTENIEDNKIYRVNLSVGEYYIMYFGALTPLSNYFQYKEIKVDSIDNVTEPEITTGMENVTIYTDTSSYIGYVFMDDSGTPVSLGVFFGESDEFNKGLVEDVSSITEGGIYYTQVVTRKIGIPNKNNEEILEYWLNEKWTQYLRLTRDMIVGVWKYDNGDYVEYLELKADGTASLKGEDGIIQKDGTFSIGSGSYFTNLIIVTFSEDDVLQLNYVVTEDAVKLGINVNDGQEYYVKQSEYVVAEKPRLISKEFTANGEYKASDDDADGYSSIVINVASSGGESEEKITIVFPESFKTAKQVYSTQVTDDKFLFAGDNGNGVWAYSLSNNVWTQVLSSGTWTAFGVLRNGICLIGSSNTYAYGVYRYKAETNTISIVYSNEYGWTNFVPLSNGDCIVSNFNYQLSGVWRYIASSDSFNKVYTRGYNWGKYIDLPDGNCLISESESGSSTSTQKGILLYNVTDNTLTRVYSSGTFWSRYKILSNGNCLISSAYSSYVGILLYNATDKTVTQIHTSGYNWQYFQELSNGDCLISSDKSAGVLRYNATDNTVTQIYASGKTWDYFQPLKDGNCLISSSSSSNIGLLLYKATDNTITQVYNMGYYWQYFQPLENGNCLISSSHTSYTYTLMYDAETQSVIVYAYVI